MSRNLTETKGTCPDIETRIKEPFWIEYKRSVHLPTRLFVGEDGHADATVVEDDSAFGVMLTDPGDLAVVTSRQSNIARTFGFHGIPNDERNYTLRIDNVVIVDKSLKHLAYERIGVPSFLQMTSNQSVAVSLIDGETRLITLWSSKQPQLMAQTKQGLWFATDDTPTKELWENVQVVVAGETSMITEMLSFRTKVLSEQQEGILGIDSTYQITSQQPVPRKRHQALRTLGLSNLNKIFNAISQVTSDADLHGQLEMSLQPLNTAQVKSNLDKMMPGYLDLRHLEDIYHQLSLLPENASEFAETFIKKTLPKLAYFTAPLAKGYRNENNVSAVQAGINQVITSGKTGRLDIFSVVCPSYNYVVDGGTLTKNTYLRHLDGQILPTVGERYSLAARATKSIFSDLAPYLPNDGITYTIYTYSGELGVDGLWEMGQDVLDYYRDNPKLLTTHLKQMFDDLNLQTLNEYANSGIKAKVVPIELVFLPIVAPIYQDFNNLFGSQIDLSPEAIDSWLLDKLGVGWDWLNYFVTQERAYGERQGVNHEYDILKSALREGLLYWAVQKQASQPDQLLWGLETTANYFVGSLPFATRTMGSIKAIMAQPFNPAKPRGNGIRQPWNIPTYNNSDNKE